MSFLERLGDLASPVEGVVDFFAPDTSQGDPGSIINSLSKGIGNAVENSVVGGLAALPGLMGSDESGTKKLLLGGLMVGGAALSAREISRGVSRSLRGNAVQAYAAKTGVKELGQYGDRMRYAPDAAGAQAYGRRRPGLNRKQLQILSAADENEAVRGIVNFDPDLEPGKAGAAAGIMSMLAARSDGGLVDAQNDLARMVVIMDTDGLVRATKQNERLRTLWSDFVDEPESFLGPENVAKAEELVSMVKQINDSLDGVDVDMSIGLAGKVTGIDMVDGQVVPHVTLPHNWADGRAHIESVREQRLRTLNYRALAADGYENLRRLLIVGKDQYDLQKRTGTSAFKRGDGDGLELGDDWYPTALEDIKRVFDFDDATDPEEISRAVAAVSFLSEAEKWSSNIEKAKRALDVIEPVVKDPELQRWLREGDKGFSKADAKRLKALYKSAWNKLTDQGLPVNDKDMRRVMQLYSGEQSVAELMSTMQARKQRNFFLNIRYPDLEEPVTIDRHAYDAFLGMDAGLNNRPVDYSLGDGDQVYDVIGDTYRQLAEDFGMTPNAVQAVIWEVWRAMKFDHPKGGWAKGQPFMLLNEQGVNTAFEALNGRGVLPGSIDVPQGPVPVSAMNATSVKDILTSVGLPNGTVVNVTGVTDSSASVFRNQWPAAKGDDGVDRWADISPLPMRSWESRHATLIETPNAHVETTLNADLDAAGGHPARQGGEYITVTLEEGQKLQLSAGLGAGRGRKDLGQTLIDEPGLRTEALRPEEIDPEDLMDFENGPLATHQWALFGADDAEEFTPILKEDILDEGQVRGLETNTREIGADEWQELAGRGREILDKARAKSDGTAGLQDEAVQQEAFTRSQRLFGGATINTKTGEFVELGDRVPRTPDGEIDWDLAKPDNKQKGRYSATVKEPGQETLSIPASASQEEFMEAWAEAQRRFPQLEAEGHYLGIFHDKIDGVPRIDFDPVYVAKTRKESDAVSAASRSLGGAFNNDDAFGYWPPYAKPRQPKLEKLRSKLVRDGKAPIEVRTASGGRAYLAFGVDPDTAEDLAKKHGFPSAITSTGRAGSGKRGFDADLQDVEILLGGGNVKWNPAQTANQAVGLEDAGVARSQRRGRKVMIPISSSADIPALLDDIAARGYRDPTVYSHRQHIEGLQRAYEELYTDGTSTVAARYSTGSPISPNGSTIFVRDAGSYPERPKVVESEIQVIEPDAPGHELVGAELIPIGDQPTGSAWIDIKKKRIHVLDENDLTEAFRLRAAAESAGFKVTDFQSPTKIFGRGTIDSPIEDGDRLRTTNGMAIARGRRDRPVEAFEEEFGFELDIGARFGQNETKVLAPEITEELTNVTRTFMDAHGDMFRYFRLDRVTMSDSIDDAVYAHTTNKAGGEIVINKNLWTDPNLTDRIAADRAAGRLSRRVGNSPGGILAHEYGHVMYLALRTKEGFKKSSDVDGAINASFGGHGKWRKAAREMSETAELSIAEFVAESISEVMYGTPSAAARQVYGVIMDLADDMLRFHRVMEETF